MAICEAFHCTELVARGQATHLGHVRPDGAEVEQADERERGGNGWMKRKRKYSVRDQSAVVCYWDKFGRLEVVFRYSHLIRRQRGWWIHPSSPGDTQRWITHHFLGNLERKNTLSSPLSLATLLKLQCVTVGVIRVGWVFVRVCVCVCVYLTDCATEHFASGAMTPRWFP